MSLGMLKELRWGASLLFAIAPSKTTPPKDALLTWKNVSLSFRASQFHQQTGTQLEVVESMTNLWHTTVGSNHRQRTARRVPVLNYIKNRV